VRAMTDSAVDSHPGSIANLVMTVLTPMVR
jgi:hypothetical protein